MSFPSWHDVVEVKAVGDRRLWIRFDDGTEGEVDLGAHLPFTGVLAPLADPRYFAEVRVHPELRTVHWPNGADLDNAVLHSLITGKPLHTA